MRILRAALGFVVGAAIAFGLAVVADAAPIPGLAGRSYEWWMGWMLGAGGVGAAVGARRPPPTGPA